MVTKLAAITILPMLLVGGVVANSSIMIVQVHEAGDGVSITVPVPLALAQVAVAFAPDRVKRLDIPEISEYLPYAERMLAELEQVPDTTLVEVLDRGDHVSVIKEGEFLRVKVREDDHTTVDVSLPLATVRGVLAAHDEDGTLHASRVISALRASPSGMLVHVQDRDDEVKVRMW